MSSPAAAAAGGQGQGGDAAQQGGQQGADAQNGQAQGLDPAALNATLEALQGGQEELRALFAQAPEWAQQLQAGQQDPGEPQAPAVDLSFLDNPALEPQEIAQQLNSQVEQLVQHGIQEALSQHIQPINDRLDSREQQEAAAEFVAEFPEVGDPKVAAEVMELSRDYAAQLGLPPELAQRLGNNYRFARVIFAATKAFEAAQDEGQGSGDPGAAHLEGGGGANPGAGGQVDASQQWAQRVAGMKRGSSVLPFG
jgi:hypothetical protein